MRPLSYGSSRGAAVGRWRARPELVQLMGWLGSLTPDESRPVPDPASDPELVDAVLATLGEGAVAWAAQVGADAEKAIIGKVEIFADEPDLRIGPESVTLGALLKFSGAPNAPDLPDDAARAISHYIVSGATLDQLLNGIRLGHATMSEAFLSACERLTTGEISPVLRATSTLLFEYIDVFAAAAANRYRADYERQTASPSLTRTRVVRDLLRADPGSVDVTAASDELGYRLDQEHLALVLEPESGARPVDLKRVAYRLARRVFASQYLILDVDDQVWAWFSGSTVSLSDQDAQEEILAGVTASVGARERGVVGFCRTHENAQAVRRLRVSAIRAPRVWDYPTAELVLTMTRDLDSAHAFVRRHLSGLDDRSTVQAELRETLLAYLDCHSSPLAAAQQMHLARNTISARVQRATTLLGTDLSAPTLELHVALRLVDTLGDDVLTATPEHP